MASPAQIAAMPAPPDDVEYRAPPVIDVADGDAAMAEPPHYPPRGQSAVVYWEEADHLQEQKDERAHIEKVTKGAIDEWLSIRAWDYQAWKALFERRSLGRLPHTALLFEVCVALVTEPTTFQRRAGGLFALYAFATTQPDPGRVRLDVDGLEHFMALQDCARREAGRGAFDVLVIFKKLFEERAVDVALRSAPRLVEVEVPPSIDPRQCLDLRGLSAAAQAYDGLRVGAPSSLVDDLERLCARFETPRVDVVDVEAPAISPVQAPPQGRYDRLLALDDLGEASDEDPLPPQRPRPDLSLPPPKRPCSDEARVAAAVRAALATGGAAAAARAALGAARPAVVVDNGLAQLRAMLDASDDDL